VRSDLTKLKQNVNSVSQSLSFDLKKDAQNCTKGVAFLFVIKYMKMSGPEASMSEEKLHLCYIKTLHLLKIELASFWRLIIES